MANLKENIKISRHKTLLRALCLLVVLSNLINWANVNAQSVDNDSTMPSRKIYLIRANTLDYDEKVSEEFQVLRGDVRFRQDSSYMYCDSAYFYEKSNSLDAFGNVRMEQGDTLFVYGDVLYYDGNEGLARLRDNVRMINRDVTLTTDSLNYDRFMNIGYYFDGGVITDPENTLSSVYGVYSPDSKNAVFQYNVELENEQYTLYSDTLRYNTQSGIADILGPSEIVSDSNVIYSDLGWYDTKKDESMLLNRSQLVSKGQVLTGDTIFYNRRSGFGEVFGNMFMNDSTRKIILEGDYGFYNEITDYAFVTQEPQAIEYSMKDSLFMHADTLKSVVDSGNRMVEAYYGVRFYRSDMQGVCDSMKYSSGDSLLTMYRNPIVWNGNYQVYGDTIFVKLNDSTIEHVLIKDFAFLSQYKQDEYYDQLTGKVMNAWFVDGNIERMTMDGNVEVIVYPEEENKSLIGLNNATSSFLKGSFENNAIKDLVMWPDVKGSLTPVPKISPESLFLANFKWYEDLRPKNKYDIFNSVEMKEEDKIVNTRLFSNDELEGVRDIDLPEIENQVRSAVQEKPKQELENPTEAEADEAEEETVEKKDQLNRRANTKK